VTIALTVAVSECDEVGCYILKKVEQIMGEEREQKG
jgi:hypothetical protein